MEIEIEKVAGAFPMERLRETAGLTFAFAGGGYKVTFPDGTRQTRIVVEDPLMLDGKPAKEGKGEVFGALDIYYVPHNDGPWRFMVPVLEGGVLSALCPINSPLLDSLKELAGLAADF